MTILQLIALKPLNTTVSSGLPVLMHVWPDRSFLSKAVEIASGRTQNKERKRELSKNKRTMDNKCSLTQTAAMHMELEDELAQRKE